MRKPLWGVVKIDEDVHVAGVGWLDPPSRSFHPHSAAWSSWLVEPRHRIERDVSETRRLQVASGGSAGVLLCLQVARFHRSVLLLAALLLLVCHPRDEARD